MPPNHSLSFPDILKMWFLFHLLVALDAVNAVGLGEMPFALEQHPAAAYADITGKFSFSILFIHAAPPPLDFPLYENRPERQG